MISQDDKTRKCHYHNKELEILCKTCVRPICYQCGLFGDHRNHNLVKIEEFQKEAEHFCEEVENIARKIEKEEYYLKDQFVEVYFTQKGKKKLESLKESINQGFRTIYDYLEHKKNKIIKNVEQRI